MAACLAAKAVADDAAPSSGAGNIEVLRIPGGGVQPQAVTGSDGTLHLVFLRGEASASDVWYTRRGPGDAEFAAPIRVNAKPGSAIAAGTIRGAQIAVGNDRVPCVVWNGSSKASTHEGEPLLFSRRTANGAFSPEVDVIRTTAWLDGGGSVAVCGGNDVAAIWHSSPRGTAGETNRAVFVTYSADGGATFGDERRLDAGRDGACGCCGLKALGRPDGALAVLYRAAGGGLNRDMTLLVASSKETPARRVVLDPWNVAMCPMSSASLAWHGKRLLAAWETREEVHAAVVDPATGAVERLPTAPGSGKRKHPSLTVNAKGEVLLAWVEGTGWNRGGSLAWQAYNSNLRPTAVRGSRDGVPVWGLATTFAGRDGRMGIVY